MVEDILAELENVPENIPPSVAVLVAGKRYDANGNFFNTLLGNEVIGARVIVDVKVGFTNAWKYKWRCTHSL